MIDHKYTDIVQSNGGCVIPLEKMQTEESFVGKFILHGPNFTNDIFESLKRKQKAELIGKLVGKNFVREIEWESGSLQQGKASRKVQLTLKTANSPLVIPSKFSHLFDLINLACQVHFSNTTINVDRTYVELLFGQGFLERGEQTFANMGMHVDTRASVAFDGGLRNEDIFVCSHSTPVASNCATRFYEGPVLLDRDKYMLKHSQCGFNTELRSEIDELFKNEIRESVRNMRFIQAKPLEVWRFPPTLVHGQAPVNRPIFRTAAVIAFSESEYTGIQNNDLLEKYYKF